MARLSLRTPPRPLPSLAAILYRRSQQLFLPAPEPGEQTAKGAARFAEGMAAHGLVLSRALFEALERLSGAQLHTLEQDVLGLTLTPLGAHRLHVPLFKNFPQRTPRDTYVFYLQRVLTYQGRSPGLPCALEGDTQGWGLSRAASVTPERACVYGTFDPGQFGGCLVCHRRVGPEGVEVQARRRLEESREQLRWLRRLDLGTDLPGQVRALLTELLVRTTPLSPEDRDDLRVLLKVEGAGALALLPEQVSQRETLALVLGALLSLPDAEQAVLAQLEDQIRTATDLLRVLDAAGGGDASLSGRVRVPRLPRWVRRAVLARLEALDDQNLTEDLGRHAVRWKRMGETLHPFEYARRFPKVAVAFAALRGTAPGEDALGAQLVAAVPTLPGLMLKARTAGTRLRFTPWSGRVETALARGDGLSVSKLLAQRPGEFGRRLDALLRCVSTGDPGALGAVQDDFSRAVPHLTTPMLLLLRAHLRARASLWPTRLVFPKGSAASFALPDTRAALVPELTTPFVEAITDELLVRAARLPHVPVVVLDERLRGLPAPYAARSAARALVTLARGARLRLPEGRFARLFVHWMEAAEQRVDLDLSVALYSSSWRHVGKCDFTHLRFARTGAVHSGDLTNAPAPLGASEFIDLDVQALRKSGVRYVVMTVLSYNGVPFEEMAEAFAGYMLRGHAGGEVFDPRSVEQRFDLRGLQQVSALLALDVGVLDDLPVLHWLDTTPRARTLGEVVGHQVAMYHDALGLSARRVIEAAGVGARPTLWDVAALHAAARTCQVIVRHEVGGVSLYRRGDDSPSTFLERPHSLAGPDERNVPLPDCAVLAFLLYHDQRVPLGSEVVAVRTSVVDEEGTHQRTFAQVLTDLSRPATVSPI